MNSFTRLTGSNFGPLADFDLSMDKVGLVLIQGDNKDTTSASSNGSGKSHLFKAITWALHGKTAEGDKDEKIIRHGQKQARVIVEWEDDSGAWRVIRAKGRAATAQLVLEHNDTDVSGQTIADTQAEINKRLGMDFNTWLNTVLYSQSDLVRFADPSTTDAERKQILKRILRLEVLDKALDKAKSQLTKLQLAVDTLAREGGQIAAELRGMASAEDLQAQMETIDAEVKELNKAAGKLGRLRKAEAGLKEVIEEVRERRSEVRGHEVDAAQHGEQKAAALAESRAAQAEVERLEGELELFADGFCPTCGTKATIPHVKKLLADLTANLETARARLEAAQTAASDATKAQADAKQKAATLTAEINAEGAEWQTKLGEVQRDISTSEQANAQTITLKRQASGLKVQLDALLDKKGALQARANEIIGEVEDIEERKRHIEFWAKGFSNQGLPSYLMDAVVPELTERANHYLGTLTDGDITVAFDTQTKLKSGVDRDKLSINWIIEGVPDATPSGGQRKKISIAVDLALMDLVAARERAATDLLMMDEVLDGLDATGKSRIMDLLGELRQKRSSIFVVSHDSGIAELFENVITVRKQGAVASLV